MQHAVIACCLAVLAGLGQVSQAAGQAPTLYVLVKDTTLQRGCFPPCLCPVMETSPVKGTFELSPAGSDGLFDYYSVTRVNWKAHLGGQDVRITGSGTYRIGGEFARTHQLSLDLVVGTDPVQHLDSGLVTGGAAFPSIDIVISINGGYCFDTVISLHAKPTVLIDADVSSLWWELVPGAGGYDVLLGDLGALRSTGGDFTSAVRGCVADDWPGGTVSHAAIPAPGEGFWFLVRDDEANAAGTYDSADEEQAFPRDPLINAAQATCP